MLCERDVPALSAHHLTPKQVGKRKGQKVSDLPKAMFCTACHRQLHSLFDNKELATRLDSVEALREDEAVAKYLAWVKKQPGETAVRVR